jgi:hypothetical protein
MEKNTLRKVKISKFDDGSGEYVTNGYFHTYGNRALATDDSTIAVMVAYVELESGEVKMYTPNRLKFVESF